MNLLSSNRYELLSIEKTRDMEQDSNSLQIHRENSLNISPVDETELGITTSSGDIKNETATPKETRKAEFRGLSLIIISSLFFSSVSLGVKILSSNPSFQIPSLELAFARTLFQTFASLAILLVIKKNLLGPNNKTIRILLVLRGLFGTFALASLYWTISVLSLSDANVIAFTAPPFTALFAYFILHEPVTILDGFSFLASITAVILVARPDFIFHNTTKSQVETSGTRIAGGIVGLLGAIAAALTVVIIRKIGKTSKEVHSLVLVFYYGIVASILLFIGMFTFQRPVLSDKFETWGAVILVSAIGFCGQVLLNTGIQIAPAGPAMLMRNLDIVFVFLFDIFLLKSSPDSLSYVGAALIILSSGLVALQKWLKANM